MTSRRKLVVVNGILRGEGHKRVCRVRAISVTNRSIPGGPAYTQPELVDPDDDFRDGSYEIVVAGGQIFPLIKWDGRYAWRV
jgi:hypothetical protein